MTEVLNMIMVIWQRAHPRARRLVVCKAPMVGPTILPRVLAIAMEQVATEATSVGFATDKAGFPLTCSFARGVPFASVAVRNCLLANQQPKQPCYQRELPFPFD